MRRKTFGKQFKIKRKNIQLIVYDFDGVMTDNKVLCSQNGQEAVFCNRSDGLGIDVIRKKGINQIIISTESNKVVFSRAQKLSLPVIQNVSDKKETLKNYCKNNNYDIKKTIYVGNDINDLEVMNISGISMCPADAHISIKRISNYILSKKGGEGAVRELADLIE